RTSIISGAGADVVTLGVAGGTLTGRSVIINTGAGNSSVALASNTSLVVGNLQIVSGEGTSLVTISDGLNVTGNVLLNLGNGGSTVALTGDVADTITGGLSIFSGAGDDNISITNKAL